MAKPAWPPPGPWQTIPGIARLVEKSAKSKALSPKTTRYCDDPARDDLGRFAGCNSSGGGGGDSSDGGGSGSEGDSGASPASGGVQPITADEARGDSRPVSADEFQSLAAEGQQSLQDMATNASSPAGLDQNWGSIKDDAYQQVQQSWGGSTYDAHTGQAFTTNDNVYAMSVKPPGVESVTVPEGATQAEFNTAMDTARAQFGDQLSYRGGALGVFHDDELQRIDIDPVITVSSLHDVETIGAATHAIGGAYNFADGNGYWPPHVGAPALATRDVLSANEVRQRYALPALRYAERKKHQAKDDDKCVCVFDYDGTITGAPEFMSLVARGLKSLGCHIVVLTGNVSPRGELVKALTDFGFPFDDLVQYEDDGTDGIARAAHLKQFGASAAFDNRVDRAIVLGKVCPHAYLIVEPSKDEAQAAKQAHSKKAAKQAAQKIGLRAFSGPPPNYRRATVAGQNCKTCHYDANGFCTKYDVDVDPQHVCDSWEPKVTPEATHP